MELVVDHASARAYLPVDLHLDLVDLLAVDQVVQVVPQIAQVVKMLFVVTLQRVPESFLVLEVVILLLLAVDQI